MQENSLAISSINFLADIDDINENFTLIEIDNKKYAIKTKDVLEIVKIMELDYPNKMPSCVLGIIQYEHNPIGVLDLRDVFKGKRITYDLSAKIIIFKTQNSTAAIVCDKVCDIKRLAHEYVREIPYQKGMNLFDGIYIKENENVYILNMDNILSYIDNNFKKFQSSSYSKYLVNDEDSRKILYERREALSKVKTEVPTNTALYDRGVSFAVNNIKYYINMASVKEFFKVNLNSKFIKIPNTKDYIFGLLNIKGEYTTVLDIRRFFNNSKTKIKDKSTIIILNSDEFKLGILADEICESMNVDFDEIIQNRFQNPDEGKMMEFVKDGEIYQVLDVEKLLQDEKLTIA